MTVINSVEFVKTVILSELAKLKDDGSAAEISEEFMKLFGDYDTYSLVYSDAFGEIKDTLEDNASEDLDYFIRRCTFMSARLLAEQHGIKSGFKHELLRGIRAGIEALGDFFTEEDIANNRVMDDADVNTPALMIALIGEVLQSTEQELMGEQEESASTVSA